MTSFLKKSAGTLFFLVCIAGCSRAQSTTESGMKWYTFEEAVRLNAKAPKKMLIDMYTSWCGWCKVMDRETFAQPKIAAIIEKYYYPVKFNAEQTEDVTFKDKVYKFVPGGRNGYHELAAAMMNGQLSYPTIVYLDEQSNLIQPVPGFQKPEQIEPVLKFFGTDAYKTTKYEDFMKTFVSEL